MTSIWAERIPVSFPPEMIEKANHLAAIIDPFPGGALTFTADRTAKDGYITANIPLVVDFVPVVMGRDPDVWMTVIAQLAEARGREPMDPDDIVVLCSTIRIGGDEVYTEQPLNEVDYDT